MNSKKILAAVLSAALYLTSGPAAAAFPQTVFAADAAAITAFSVEKENLTIGDVPAFQLTLAENVSSATLVFSVKAGAVTASKSFVFYDLEAGTSPLSAGEGNAVSSDWYSGTYTLTKITLKDADGGSTVYEAADTAALAGKTFAVTGGKEAPQQYTATVKNGTSTYQATATAGAELELEAKEPAEGRVFDGWILPADIEITKNTVKDLKVTVRMPAHDFTAEAVYKDASETPAKKYVLTWINKKDGEDETREYAAGTVIELTYTPKENVTFDTWALGDGLELLEGALTDLSIKVKMPAKPTSVEAKITVAGGDDPTPAPVPGEMRADLCLPGPQGGKNA